MREDSEILNTQAIDLASSGDYPEAIACLKRALIMDRDNYLLWFNLGVTYRNAGDLIKAKEALCCAYDINPEDEDVLDTLGLISFSLGENNESFNYYTEGLDVNPANIHILNNIGVLYFSRGEYEKAGASFERALTVFPHYYDALFNLRDTYEELGNEAGVQVCSERLRHLAPPQS